MPVTFLLSIVCRDILFVDDACLLFCRLLLLAHTDPRLDSPDDHRQEADQHDRDDNKFKVVLHEGDAAKEIPQQREDRHPQHPADNVKEGKAGKGKK